MRTVRLMLSLMMTCSLLITTSSPARAAATLTADGQIQAPKSDVREVVADNAALVAEVEAVRQALAAERKSTQDLIDELNAYTAVSEEERALLREQNEMLKKMADAYKKQVSTEKQKGLIKLIIGLAVGGVIGAAAS